MANRADLANRCKKTKMCKFFLANACERGDRCAYAHSRAEVRATPDLRCTQFCPTALSGNTCCDTNCKFAHRREQLKKFPGGNSHKDQEVGSRPAASNLMLTQASLAALAAQQASIVTPSLSSNALMSGIQCATVSRQDLAALMQAQAAISQALVSLEERLRVSSSKKCAGSYVSDSNKYSCDARAGIDSCNGLAASDEGTIEFGSQVDGLKRCWPESDQATDSLRSQSSLGEVSEASEPDIALTVADVGIAFGKQISDFGPVFSRQASYKREAEGEGLPAAIPSNIHDTKPACGSTKLCIKNTFYTLTEEEPPRTSCPRSSSAPARFVSRSAARQTASLSCGSAMEASQPPSKRHIQAIRVKQPQSPQALSPLPEGPSQAGPVKLGRRLVGTGRDDFQIRKDHSSAI